MEEEPEKLSYRCIPHAVILTLVMQVAGILIWATQLDARVNGMEQQSVSNSAFNEKFARLDERLDNMKEDMSGLKHQLDRLTEHFLKP